MKLTKLLYVIVALLLAGCSGSGNDDPTAISTPTPIVPTTTLKEAASFPIGNIVFASRLLGNKWPLLFYSNLVIKMPIWVFSKGYNK